MRPGYGTEGIPAHLWTNYFELGTPSEDMLLYYYTMSVDPDKDDKVPTGKKRMRLIKLLLAHDDFRALEPSFYATDFNTILVTDTKLRGDLGIWENSAVKIVVELTAEGAIHPAVNPIYYTVHIQAPQELRFSNLKEFLNPRTPTSDYNKAPILQAFQTVLGDEVKRSNQLALVGSKKVFPLSTGTHQTANADVQIDLGRGLTAIRGFYSSVVGATSRILVNVNISHGGFYNAVSLKLLIENFGLRDYEELHRFLKSLRVRTTHLSPDHQAYGKIRTISGLAIKGDGSRQDHPPNIDRDIGADPSQVEFFEDHFGLSSGSPGTLKDHITNKQKASQSSQEAHGGYITVRDFFKKSKGSMEYCVCCH